MSLLTDTSPIEAMKTSSPFSLSLGPVYLVTVSVCPKVFISSIGRTLASICWFSASAALLIILISNLLCLLLTSILATLRLLNIGSCTTILTSLLPLLYSTPPTVAVALILILTFTASVTSTGAAYFTV